MSLEREKRVKPALGWRKPPLRLTTDIAKAKGLRQIVTLRALTGIWETVRFARSQCRLMILSQSGLARAH